MVSRTRLAATHAPNLRARESWGLGKEAEEMWRVSSAMCSSARAQTRTAARFVLPALVVSRRFLFVCVWEEGGGGCFCNIDSSMLLLLVLVMHVYEETHSFLFLAHAS